LCTETRLSRGRAGIPIRAFGMKGRRSSSELASASDFLVTTDGAGTTGVSTGIITTRFSITRRITHQARRFITATDSIEAEASAVFTTALKERHSLSAATAGLLAAMPSLAARAAFAPARSAASAMAERNGIFLRAEALALAVEAAFTAADTAERTQL
jgi:hypothetical protein